MKWKSAFLRKAWPYLLALVLVAALRELFYKYPPIGLQAYENGFFIGIRWLFDHTLGLLPFPPLYLLFPLALWLAWRMIASFKRGPSSGFLQLVKTGIWIWIAFMVLWGFSYQMPTLQQRVDWPKQSISDSFLLAQCQIALDEVEKRRALYTLDTSALYVPKDIRSIENQIREELRKTLRDLGYAARGTPRCRILPAGMLRYLGILGIYMPFVGEGHIDKGGSPAKLPVTMAHELAHAFGVTDEGEASFVGYLCCEQSDSYFLRYSASFNYALRLLKACYRIDREKASELLKSAGTGFKADVELLRALAGKYQNDLQSLSYLSNDAYLKLQGVKSGIKSYDQELDWILRWKAANNCL